MMLRLLSAFAVGAMSVTSAFAQDAATTTGQITTGAASPAPASTSTIALPAAPEGKGQIVFFRSGGMGFAMGCGVNENGERVSALGAGRYFVHATTPGSHTYIAKSEAKDVLAVDVAAGSTSYVRCTIKIGHHGRASQPDAVDRSGLRQGKRQAQARRRRRHGAQAGEVLSRTLISVFVGQERFDYAAARTRSA